MRLLISKKILLLGLIVIIQMNIADSSNGISKWETSGEMFSEFYHITKSESEIPDHQKPQDMENISPEFEGCNGFQIRRITLNFNRDLTENLSTNFKFQMGNSVYSQNKMEPYVKNAYIKWKYSENHNIYWGISNSACFQFIEKFWGHRPMEKTSSDFFCIRSSSEFGIALKGKLFEKLGYHLLAGNGEGYKSEKTSTKDKLYTLALDYSPADKISMQIYSDAKIDRNNKNNNEYTGQIFTGFKTSAFRFAFQYTYQNNKLLASNERGNVQLLSFPFIVNLHENISFVSQFAYYKEDSSTDIAQKFFTSGMDFHPVSYVHIIPNFIAVQYDNNENKSYDIVSRLNISYTF